MRKHTESALRAVIDVDGDAYEEAIGKLHPRRGEKGKLLTTVFLCKAAIAIGLTKEPPFPEIPEEMEERIQGAHAASFSWGDDFANRFTTEEAKTLWQRFEPLDALLQMDEEHFVPGFSSEARCVITSMTCRKAIRRLISPRAGTGSGRVTACPGKSLSRGHAVTSSYEGLSRIGQNDQHCSK